ncbi:unnamed protein product [Gadus morhua 'NCC']
MGRREGQGVMTLCDPQVFILPLHIITPGLCRSESEDTYTKSNTGTLLEDVDRRPGVNWLRGRLPGTWCGVLSPKGLAGPSGRSYREAEMIFANRRPQDLSDDLSQSRAGCSPGPFCWGYSRTFFRLRDLAHRVLSHLKSGCVRGRRPHPHARDLMAFDLAEVDLP